MSTVTDAAATTQIYRIFIKATPEAIWTAITDKEWAGRYGYGGHVEYELKPGGQYRVRPSDEMRAYGAPDVMLVGEVIEVEAPRRLVQTWHPLSDPASAAEAVTRLTWEIEPQGTFSKLTVSHDVAGAPLAGRMVNGDVPEAGGGWSWILSDMKSVLETGVSMR